MGIADERTLVLHGATVRTLSSERPAAAGVVVRGERVQALLGPGERGPAGAERVDLGGAEVLPGLRDAHVHVPSWAHGLRELDLRGTRSLAEALARVRAALAGAPADGWLRGRGWRDEEWPDRASTAALDAVCGDRRVALRAQDGHSLWLSSAALRVAGVHDPAGMAALAVPGGVVEDSGILREESAWAFQARFLEPSADETLAAVRAALPALAAAGVTCVHDFDGGRGAPAAFAALRDAGELTVRVQQSLPHDRIERPFADGGLLRLGHVKAFMDGTLGSRTAWLLDGSGVAILDADGLVDVIERAAAFGAPVAVHAIGDAANRAALDAFARTRHEWAQLTPAPRIEHAQCVHPDDVARFAALGVAASIQPSHAISDRALAERIWADRLGHAYPYGSLQRAGARLLLGSDAPVEPLDPLAGLRAAEAHWRAGQALEPDVALAASTCGPLAPGAPADLTVVTPDRGTVLATMVAGRFTHGP